MSDLIDRQKAIDVVMECYDNDELFEVYEDRLNELPPIQPKRGRWEQKDFKYHCSCCDGIAPKAIRWDFCPHCGAKMEVNHE